MSPELIAILAVGVTLAGVLLSGQRALRSEMRDVRSEMRDVRSEMRDLCQSTEARFAGVEAQIADLRQSTEARFAAVENQITDLRERMAKLEGLLEGLREAIVARAAQNVTQ